MLLKRFHRVLLPVGLTLPFLTVSAGCVDLRDSSPKNHESIPVSRFCSAMRAAAQPPLCSGLEMEACNQLLDSRLGARLCERLPDSIASGRVTYDGNEAARCVNELEPSQLAAGWENAFMPSCHALMGELAVGETCDPANLGDCKNGYCSSEQDACLGECKASAYPGESCGGGIACARGSRCESKSNEGRRCVADPPPGEACDRRCGSDAESSCVEICESGSLCDTVDGARLCIVQREDGRSCSSDNQCMLGFCRDGVCDQRGELGARCSASYECHSELTCAPGSPEERFCQARYSEGESCLRGLDQCTAGLLCPFDLSSAGSRCRTDRGKDGHSCEFRCEADHFCNKEGGTLVCRPDRGQGEDCSSEQILGGVPNRPCQEGLYCMESGSCLPAGTTGESCARDRTESCIEGLWCSVIDSRCVAPSPEGELCDSRWTDTCDADMFCASSKEGEEERCRSRLSDGEVCERDGACMSGHCELVWIPDGTPEAGTCEPSLICEDLA